MLPKSLFHKVIFPTQLPLLTYLSCSHQSFSSPLYISLCTLPTMLQTNNRSCLLTNCLTSLLLYILVDCLLLWFDIFLPTKSDRSNCISKQTELFRLRVMDPSYWKGGSSQCCSMRKSHVIVPVNRFWYKKPLNVKFKNVKITPFLLNTI